MSVAEQGKAQGQSHSTEQRSTNSALQTSDVPQSYTQISSSPRVLALPDLTPSVSGAGLIGTPPLRLGFSAACPVPAGSWNVPHHFRLLVLPPLSSTSPRLLLMLHRTARGWGGYRERRQQQRPQSCQVLFRQGPLGRDQPCPVAHQQEAFHSRLGDSSLQRRFAALPGAVPGSWFRRQSRAERSSNLPGCHGFPHVPRVRAPSPRVQHLFCMHRMALCLKVSFVSQNAKQLDFLQKRNKTKSPVKILCSGSLLAS